MGSDISTSMHGDCLSMSIDSLPKGKSKKSKGIIKPNKVKKSTSYFHSKPSDLVDFIVNKNWQKVLNRCTSHPKEIYMTQKIRLYGTDRKLLPLHIACAMQPPAEVIAALLRPDTVTGMSTVKTLMKNAKKKNRIIGSKDKSTSASGSGSICSREAAPMSYPQLILQQSSSSMGGAGDGIEIECKGSEEGKEVIEPPTCRTAPLSPSLAEGDEGENYNQMFFPEKESRTGFALQITPSGEVKQISPNGKSCRAAINSESPFVYASQSHNEQKNTGDQMKVRASYQSAIADDFLPIHIACLYRASPEVIAFLIKCYPEGMEHKNKWGMLPLHIVCSNYYLKPPAITASKLDDDFTTKAFLNNLYNESMEDEMNKWDIAKVVEMLVTSFPQSVNVPSDNIEWYTPLEYAARNIQDKELRDKITSYLKKKQDQNFTFDGASASYGAGNDALSLSSSLSDSKASHGKGVKALPISDCTLLYTYILGKQWDSIHDRLQQVPDEASFWIIDKNYPRLPIHLACENSAPLEVIEALLNAYPEGCIAKDGSGSYPLHLACANVQSSKIIFTLLKRAIKASKAKDDIGRLPLHLACVNGADPAVIKALLDAYPTSCTVKDYNGHTAMTYVEYNESDEDEKLKYAEIFEQYENGNGILADDRDDR